VPSHGHYGYGTDHHIDNKLSSKKKSGQKNYVEYNNQIEQLFGG
jgi:hypothetical protein